MKFKERDASSKRKYSKISISKRQKLIDLVIQQGESLIKITKKLNINLSTARLILKLYRSTGSFHMKNFKHPPKEDQCPTLMASPTENNDFEEQQEDCNQQQGQEQKEEDLEQAEEEAKTAQRSDLPHYSKNSKGLPISSIAYQGHMRQQLMGCGQTLSKFVETIDASIRLKRILQQENGAHGPSNVQKARASIKTTISINRSFAFSKEIVPAGLQVMQGIFKGQKIGYEEKEV